MHFYRAINGKLGQFFLKVSSQGLVPTTVHLDFKSMIIQQNVTNGTYNQYKYHLSNSDT